jgi:hypothetical protein
VRGRKGSYNRCVVGCIPSFCWIIIRKDLTIYLVDVAHIGCIFCVLFAHLFYFIAL